MKKSSAFLAVFSHRDPALLITGQSISNFGDGVANVALTLLVLETTHQNPAQLGLFAAARMAPTVILLLFGGALVDRVSRRLVLLTSDLVRMALTAGLVVLMLAHVLAFWHLLIFAALFGTFDAAFFPAFSALIPEVVTEKLLPAFNALRPIANNVIGGVLGYTAGAILAAWSTSVAISIDSLTFLASAMALIGMHPTAAPFRAEATSILSDIREGVRFTFSHRWIWTTLLGVTLSNAFIFTPMGVLVPYFLVHDLHSHKASVGIFGAMFGVGAVVGAYVVGSRPLPRRRIRTMWGMWTIGCLAALIVSAATNVWEVMLFPLITGPCIVYGGTIWETMLQQEVPKEILGRVSSVDWFVSLGISPLGLLLAGQLTGMFGTANYFLVASLVCAIPGIIILASRRINAVDAPRLAPGWRPPDASPSLDGG